MQSACADTDFKAAAGGVSTTTRLARVSCWGPITPRPTGAQASAGPKDLTTAIARPAAEAAREPRPQPV